MTQCTRLSLSSEEIRSKPRLDRPIGGLPDPSRRSMKAGPPTPGPAGSRLREGPGVPTLPRGATIGRYVVLGLVGRGGMGEVYAAYDPELDRKVAVKLLRVKPRQRRLAPRGAAADAARGAGDRAPVAPERRRRLRRRHVRGAGVHRDGVRRREHPQLLAAGRSRAAGGRSWTCSWRRGAGWRPRTTRGWSTATSSPTTSWSDATARCASWTSGSRAR